MVALETLIGLGPLGMKELDGGCIAQSQVAAQGTRGNRFLRDGIGLVLVEDGDEGPGRAPWLLPFQSFGPVQGLG